MKKAIVFTCMIVFLLVSCGPSEADIQKAIAQTQAALPTATPTPTLEEAYCTNFADTNVQLEQFTKAIDEWGAFLNASVGGNSSEKWGNVIGMTIYAGPLVGELMKNSEDQVKRDGIAKFIMLSKNLEEEGTRLQIKISSVTPSQNIQLSHEKLINCFETMTMGASQIVNFFEQSEPIESLPSSEACSSLNLYLQEIRNICKK